MRHAGPGAGMTAPFMRRARLSMRIALRQPISGGGAPVSACAPALSRGPCAKRVTDRGAYRGAYRGAGLAEPGHQRLRLTALLEIALRQGPLQQRPRFLPRPLRAAQ